MVAAKLSRRSDGLKVVVASVYGPVYANPPGEAMGGAGRCCI